MMSHQKRLGEILLEACVINEEQLDAALRIQQSNRQLLGEILVELGWATEQEVCRAVAQALHVRYLDVQHILLSQETLQLIPEHLIRTSSILPLFVKDARLYVAVEHLPDEAMLRELAHHTRLRISPVIAPPVQLRRAIQTHSSPDDYLDHLFQYRSPEQNDGARQDVLAKTELDENRSDLHIQRLLAWIVADALKKRASDILIAPSASSARLRYTIDGLPARGPLLPTWLQVSLIATVKALADLDAEVTHRPQKGRFRLMPAARETHLRVTTTPGARGEIVNIRLLEKKRALHHLNRLGLSSDQQSLCRAMTQTSRGWMIVAGAAHCGVTTTLYALMNALKGGRRRMATLENPVECPLPGVSQFQMNSTIEAAFAEGIQSLLPQRPDILVVGEVRDADTAALILDAVQKGHLILSTSPAADVLAALTRLFHLGVTPEALTKNVLMVTAQRLVRRICPQCKTRSMPTEQELQQLGVERGHESEFVCYQGTGCATCQGTGYYGQIGIYEVFHITPDIRPKLTTPLFTTALYRLLLDSGMVTFQDEGLRKIQQGLTTIEEVLRVCGSRAQKRNAVPTCHECGQPLGELTVRCSSCRTVILESCEQCHAQLEPEWIRCPYCGFSPTVSERFRAADSQALVHRQTGSQTRILLAEPDDSMQEMLSLLLEEQGYEIVTTTQTEETRTAVCHSHPDIIILDDELHQRRWTSLLQAIRADIAGTFVPIILLTRQQDLEIAIEGIAFGLGNVFSKPIDVDRLLDRIDSIIRTLSGKPLS